VIESILQLRLGNLYRGLQVQRKKSFSTEIGFWRRAARTSRLL